MKPGLCAGATRTHRHDIVAERSVMEEGFRIYSTPSLVMDMEMTCHDLLGEYLSDTESAVGERVEMDYLAATLEGMWVEVTATVTSVAGRRVNFMAEVRDEFEVVGRATHVRFVVDLAKQRERLDARAVKLAQRG